MLVTPDIKQRLDAMRQETPSGFVRLSCNVKIDSPLAWLHAQSLTPRLYWHPRDQHAPEYALIGCLHEVTEPGQLQALCGNLGKPGIDSPRYFGGMAFDAQAKGWPGFGPCRFVLPRIELVRQGATTTLYLNLLFDGRDRNAELAEAEASLLALRAERPLLPSLTPVSFTREDRPTPSEWAKWVQRATSPSFQAYTSKVVLSRESRLTTTQPVNPWQLLAHWQARASDCSHLCLQFTTDEAFIACSPERLYRREGSQLSSEALAGTARRSSDDIHDEVLAANLLADPKNCLENRLVHADILQRLGPFSRSTSFGERRILKLRSLQHIKSDITAELHPWVHDGHLLEALHPTPAVGGTPREAALDFIRTHETHRRGWYAGACGMLSRNLSDLAVAIRSAHVTPRAVTLFAGAGIVAGSAPDDEWTELDNKIADVMSLLG